MRNIARLSDNDRRELFRNTADKMGLNLSLIHISHILYIIRDIRQLAGRSSRASGTRWVHPPWEPDGRYIPLSLIHI